MKKYPVVALSMAVLGFAIVLGLRAHAQAQLPTELSEIDAAHLETAEAKLQTIQMQRAILDGQAKPVQDAINEIAARYRIKQGDRVNFTTRAIARTPAVTAKPPASPSPTPAASPPPAAPASSAAPSPTAKPARR